MKSSVPATRSSTAAARQNYAAQPVTGIRNKFDKSRGHIGKTHNSKDDTDLDDSFADLPMAPALPSFKAEGHVTEHLYIGSPGRSSRPVEPTTPLAELQARAVRVRAALEAQLPRLPAVSSELVGRERELAEEAAREYEPTGRDIMAAITTMSRSMVVREEIKADIAEAVLPLNERMGHMEATLTTVHAQTANLNDRLVRAESSWATHVDRIKKLEEKLTALQNTSATSRGKAFDDSFQKLAVVGFEPKMTLEHRLVAMQAYMESNFPKVDARYLVVHSWSWKDKGKHRKMTSVGLIDVGSPDVREMLMKAIESKDVKVLCQGKQLKVARAKTKIASDRDSALIKAADFLKKQPGTKNITIEWVGHGA